MRNQRLSRTIGVRLALSACSALALAAVAAPSAHLTGGSSSQADTSGSNTELVLSNQDIPEVDIIGTQDGSLSSPTDLTTDPGSSAMAVVTIQAHVPPAPTCTFTSMTPDNLAQVIAGHEGFNTHVYPDSRHHPSIGYGFNLDRPGAAATLAGIGVDYNAVRSGQQNITLAQAQALLGPDVAAAVNRARAYFPSYDSLSPGRQAALADMAFNLANRLGTFRLTMIAVAAGNWSAVGNEVLQSLWAAQVGYRAVYDSDNLVACN